MTATAAPTTDAPIEQIRVVYVGLIELDNHKRGDKWIQLAAGDKLPDAEMPGSRIVLEADKRQPTIGGIYTMHRQGDSYFTKGARAPQYAGKYSDAEQVAAWDAASYAVEARQRAAKRAKDAAAADPFDELIAPLVRAYLKTDRLGRSMFVARVIERLTRAGFLGR